MYNKLLTLLSEVGFKATRKLNEDRFKKIITGRDKIIKKYLFDHTIHKLHIGCGPLIHTGWLNTDIDPIKNRSIYMDAGDIYPFVDNTFDYIYSEHLFEHLTFKQSLIMLCECHRVLKPGGVLRIATPNYKFLLELYNSPEAPLHKQYIQWASTMFFAQISDVLGTDELPVVYIISNFHRAWGHRIIYDFKVIEALGSSCDYSEIHSCKINESKYPDLANMEKHGELIPSFANELETMIIEMKK